jgi:ABC-type lipoprotein release transport system permease subunit
MRSYLSIFKIALHGRSATKILLATIFSFTFSIAVILCTFGLMDGFDFLLKSGLRYSSGDILITNRRGFFSLNPDLKQKISSINPLSIAPVIQTEAFIIHQDISKGVVVRGIEDRNFSISTGLNISLPSGGIVIGRELADQLNIKVDDSIALTFGRGNETASSLPMIQTFNVTSIIQHGIYQKDLRFVYLNRSDLSIALGIGEKINLIILGTQNPIKPLNSLDDINLKQMILKNKLDSGFTLKPFWNEYDFLIEAVKIEKFSISLILQLIVLVAVFNIIAFVIYIMEKKAQDFFFLRAIGLSLKNLSAFWFFSILMIWGCSCVGAHFLSLMFNWSLKNLSFLQIPGEVYVLSSLSIKLDFVDYLTVYGISLLWILFASFIGYLRIKKKPIIQGLRQEFS